MSFEDIAETAGEISQWWNDAQWHYVSSSNVDAFRYDQTNKRLSIMFHGGRVYTYFNIGPDMAEGLATASSPGGWFHANLRGAPFERGE